MAKQGLRPFCEECRIENRAAHVERSPSGVSWSGRAGQDFGWRRLRSRFRLAAGRTSRAPRRPDPRPRTRRRPPCAPARPTPASPVSTRRAAGTPPGRRGRRPICCARSAAPTSTGSTRAPFSIRSGRRIPRGAHDAALTLAALSYAEALARGRTDPTRLSRPYTLPRPNPDLAAGLSGALAHGAGRRLARRPGAAGRRLSRLVPGLCRGQQPGRGGARQSAGEPARPRAHARGQSRAAPLAGAHPADDADRRQHRRGPADLLARRRRPWTAAGSWSASRGARRPSSPRRCSGWSPTRPGPCPIRSRAR